MAALVQEPAPVTLKHVSNRSLANLSGRGGYPSSSVYVVKGIDVLHNDSLSAQAMATE